MTKGKKRTHREGQGYPKGEIDKGGKDNTLQAVNLSLLLKGIGEGGGSSNPGPRAGRNTESCAINEQNYCRCNRKLSEEKPRKKKSY